MPQFIVPWLLRGPCSHTHIRRTNPTYETYKKNRFIDQKKIIRGTKILASSFSPRAASHFTSQKSGIPASDIWIVIYSCFFLFNHLKNTTS